VADPPGARRPADYAKDIGAIAGAIGAVVTLAVLVVPRLGCGPTCTQDPAVVEQIELEPGVTWRQYLEEIGSKNATGNLDAPGTIVHPNLVLTGYKGDRIPVTWTLFHATGTVVKAPGFTNRLAYAIDSERCNEPVSQPIWVPEPPQAGRYFVRLSVYDRPGGVVVHTSKASARFSVA
jgi:hypothetical protein